MKRLLIIGIILLIFCSVSAVSAADNMNDTQSIGGKTDFVLPFDNVQLNNNGIEVNNSIGTTPGNLDDLQNEVNSANSGSTLDLNRDYVATKGTPVTISKELTIDGHGHTIDCKRLCNAFDVNSELVIIKNLRIINGFTKDCGGAICTHIADDNIKLFNCTFEKNEAEDCGGAIYDNSGYVSISNCTFKNNVAGNKGGAVFASNTVCYSSSILHSTFIENKAKSDDGGAIYFKRSASEVVRPEISFYLDYCNFTKNYANKGDGGAVYVEGRASNLYVSKSIFIGNYADGGITRRFGGAICTEGYIYSNGNYFKDNWAENRGGAIYTRWVKEMNDCYFEGNIAKDGHGGAVYADENTRQFDVTSFEVNHCSFIKNQAIKGDGGAVYINSCSQVTFNNCNFTENSADKGSGKRDGGAIYCPGFIGVCGCYFKDNWAENRGGAIYTDKILGIHNCYFESNKAKNGDGGAMYINSQDVAQKGVRNFTNCVFKNNSATKGDGGAVYLDSIWSEHGFIGCTFTGNNADRGVEKRYGGAICSKGTILLDSSSFADNCAENLGGAVYAGEIKYIKNCIFTSNKAKEGGAVYVNGKSTITVEKSYFKLNKATNGRGGAIYLDSKFSKLTLTNNAFVNDDASGQGKEVFNSGYYSTIKNNWWGQNSPSFDNEKLMEYHTLKSNEKHKDDAANSAKITITKEGNNYVIKINFAYAINPTIANDIMLLINGNGIIVNKTINGNCFELTADGNTVNQFTTDGSKNVLIGLVINSYKTASLMAL